MVELELIRYEDSGLILYIRDYYDHMLHKLASNLSQQRGWRESGWWSLCNLNSNEGNTCPKSRTVRWLSLSCMPSNPFYLFSYLSCTL